VRCRWHYWSRRSARFFYGATVPIDDSSSQVLGLIHSNPSQPVHVRNYCDGRRWGHKTSAGCHRFTLPGRNVDSGRVTVVGPIAVAPFYALQLLRGRIFPFPCSVVSAIARSYPRDRCLTGLTSVRVAGVYCPEGSMLVPVAISGFMPMVYVWRVCGILFSR